MIATIAFISVLLLYLTHHIIIRIKITGYLRNTTPEIMSLNNLLFHWVVLQLFCLSHPDLISGLMTQKFGLQANSKFVRSLLKKYF